MPDTKVRYFVELEVRGARDRQTQEEGGSVRAREGGRHIGGDNLACAQCIVKWMTMIQLP